MQLDHKSLASEPEQNICQPSMECSSVSLHLLPTDWYYGLPEQDYITLAAIVMQLHISATLKQRLAEQPKM